LNRDTTSHHLSPLLSSSHLPLWFFAHEFKCSVLRRFFSLTNLGKFIAEYRIRCWASCWASEILLWVRGMNFRLAPTPMLPRRRFVAGKLKKLLSLSGVVVVKEARRQNASSSPLPFLPTSALRTPLSISSSRFAKGDGYTGNGMSRGREWGVRGEAHGFREAWYGVGIVGIMDALK
jgi:hypothetical protein